MQQGAATDSSTAPRQSIERNLCSDELSPWLIHLDNPLLDGKTITRSRMQGLEPPAGNEPKKPANPAARRNSWAWPTAWMLTVLVVFASGLYVFKSCHDFPADTLDHAGKVVEKVGQKAQQVAAAFKQGSVTTTFTSYGTTLSGSQYIQFATLSQVERFTPKDESSRAFGYLPLPD